MSAAATRTDSRAAGREAAPAPLLPTKLHAPGLRREFVDRAALVERLVRSSAPLTLLAAPAGSGKTTLLAAWRASPEESRPFAWLSLDRGDNDPVRFWAYMVEAVRVVAPDVGEPVLALLRAPGTDLIETVAPTAVAELERLENEIVLVLDDYHLVSNREVHASVEFLVEHLPAPVHVVIATRADPPLPVARLRVGGDLIEIRAQDLSFSEPEAAVLLNHVTGLTLGHTDVTRLHDRTEGWAAGLYLAALTIRGRSDAREFIEAFAGDDRHVVDYLVSEVLDREPDDVRTFLVRTSILDRLSGSLCDAVLERSGSAEMLTRLERSNLFIVPLDNRREWYRYHHLFSDLLVHELRRAKPELVPGLHRRAAAWHRAQGLISEAIHHALAGGDVVEASDLAALHWNDFLNQGRLETVAGWLDAFPEEVIRADARLCIARAGRGVSLGRRDEVEEWLDRAEAAPLPSPVRRGASTIEAEATIYRTANRFMTGDVSRALEAGRRAIELEQDDRSPWRSMALAALGRTLFWSGEAAESEQALREAVKRWQPSSNNLSVIGALGYLAMLHVDRGDLDEADAIVEDALSRTEMHGFSEHWVQAMALVARARVLAERGPLAAARPLAARAVELTRRGSVPIELAYALFALADVLEAAGDAAAAAAARDEAQEVVDRCPDPGILRRRARVGRRQAAVADELTTKELDVLRLLPTGRSLRDIAAALYVSRNTVKTHVRSVYRKLDVSTRAEAVARARERGLV
jgi:LuxR family transcriptional regulator, maltose regulon positive regulatory protein